MQLNIIGINYNVKIKQNVSEVSKGDPSPHWGEVDFLNKEIRLYKDIEPETLIHEILHIVSDALRLGLNEDQIVSFGQVFADTLIRNDLFNMESFYKIIKKNESSVFL